MNRWKNFDHPDYPDHPNNPTSLRNSGDGITFTIFVWFPWNFVWRSLMEGYHLRDCWPCLNHPTHPAQPTQMTNFGNFGPILMNSILLSNTWSGHNKNTVSTKFCRRLLYCPDFFVIVIVFASDHNMSLHVFRSLLFQSQSRKELKVFLRLSQSIRGRCFVD